MFRRFRRHPQKNTQEPPKSGPYIPPIFSLPERIDVFDEAGNTPTLPLPSVHAPADGWLVEEALETQQRPQVHSPPYPQFQQRPPATSQRPASQPRRPANQVMQVDPEQVARYLEAYVNAPTWDGSRQLVEDHPELLSNTALMLMRANMVRVAEQVGPGAAQIMSRYLQTLEVAQREGAAFAFERMASPFAGMFAPDLDALLTQLESPAASQHLEERVALCEAALPLAARDQNDELWAALQREIGLTLPRLRYGDHTQHIEHAIEALDAALQIFTRIEYPTDWAMTQHYLGIALMQRVNGNRAGNIDQAIETLEQALEIRKRETMPQEWAATQEALGSAYYHRVNGSRADNIDHCIADFEAALTVRTPEKTPFEWATDQLSLGNAYGQRTTGTRIGNIEQAITGFEAALSYFTRENAPDQWALIHHNLGVAYVDRFLGNRGDNIECALDHYQQAISVQTRERAPIEYADTLNNIGNAYRERVQGNREENRQHAITAYKEALRIRTRDAFLAEHRRTARNLGSLLFEMGRWSEAHDILAGAIAASETLYMLGLGQENRNQRLRDHGELVALDAFCLAKLSRPRDAVQRLERGRARILNELLERERLMLAQLPAAERTTFAQAQARLLASYQAAQRIISKGASLTSDNHNLRLEDESLVSSARRTLDDLFAERREAQAVFDAAVTSIRKTRPDFLYPALSFKQIVSSIGKQQSLVYLTTTTQGTLAMLINEGATDLTDDHLLWAPLLTTERLEEAMPHTLDDENAMKTQLGYLPRPKVLDGLLELLGTTLMTPLAQRLDKLGMASVVLIPAGRLAALPLHAAPVGESVPGRDDEGVPAERSTTSLFLDVIEVSYAPSAQRLLAARAGSMMVLRSGVAAIGNPQPASAALEWAEHEAEAVAQVTSRSGQSCTLLIRRQATAEAVIKAIKERAYIHLACAGFFNPERPLDAFLELAGGDAIKLADMLAGKLSLRGVRLLVLSAGHAAMMSANAPDESIGMAAGMLTAGAAGVVASLWPASDLATLLLMRRFAHNYLNDDQHPAQALRAAQRWLRSLTLKEMQREYSVDLGRDPDYNLADFAQPQDCPFAHPFFWAGFILQGV